KCLSDNHDKVVDPSVNKMPKVSIKTTSHGTFEMTPDSVYWRVKSGTYGVGTFVMGLDFDFPTYKSFDDDISIEITVKADGSIMMQAIAEEDYGQDYQLLGANNEMLTEFNFHKGGSGDSYTFNGNNAAPTSYGVNNAAQKFSVMGDSQK